MWKRHTPQLCRTLKLSKTGAPDSFVNFHLFFFFLTIIKDTVPNDKWHSNV